jgi:hypothetical protein
MMEVSHVSTIRDVSFNRPGDVSYERPSTSQHMDAEVNIGEEMANARAKKVSTRSRSKMSATEFSQSQREDTKEALKQFKNDTFTCIRDLLMKQHSHYPVIFIIKNIKLFNVDVLNDLIHLLKKYREGPNFLKLNLMLGMGQSNSDELHQRISI